MRRLRFASSTSFVTVLSVLLVSGACTLACSGATGGGGEPGPGDDTGGTGDDTGGNEGGGDTGGGDGTSDGDEVSVLDAGDDTEPPFDAGETGTGCTIAGCGADTDCDGISDTVEGKFATGG